MTESEELVHRAWASMSNAAAESRKVDRPSETEAACEHGHFGCSTTGRERGPCENAEYARTLAKPDPEVFALACEQAGEWHGGMG